MWNIAKQLYGASALWEQIYQTNSDQIKDPNFIRIGQRLVIP